MKATEAISAAVTSGRIMLRESEHGQDATGVQDAITDLLHLAATDYGGDARQIVKLALRNFNEEQAEGRQE
jgi:hypothetical protein